MTVDDDPANNATAQTLNYALGNLGGRRKSWMLAANPSPQLTTSELATNPLPFTVRKRGRPRKYPVPQPTATYTPVPTIEPQAEVQPPSNSTSPQLANVVARPNHGNAGASAVTVFPSPTPSEESNSIAPARLSFAGNSTANLDFLELNTGQTAYAPDTPSETVSMDDARRPSNGSKRSFVDAGAQVQKRVQHARPPVQASTTDQSQPSTQPRPQQTHSRDPSFEQLSNGEMPWPQLPQVVQPGPNGMMPPQGPVPCAPHRTSSLGGHPHHRVLDDNPSPVNSGSFQTPHLANFQSTWYTREECIKVLTAFQASFAVSPSHERDPRRINVLRDATERHDWPYLTMHQLYCLLESNPSLVPAEIRNHPGLNKAVSVMSHVLDSNEKLSPAVLRFFSSFPYHLAVIRTKWPAGFEQQMKKFMSFVVSATNYDSLILTCEKRRFPPVTWELAYYLGLESTTFHRLLFTAILRRIWRGLPHNLLQPQYEAEAVNLFQRNQAAFYERTAQQPNGQWPNHDQVVRDNTEELHRWGIQLKRLVEALEATLRQQGYSVSSPPPIISPYAQQSPVHVQQQQQRQQQPQQQHPAVIEADMGSRNSRGRHPYSAQAAIQQPRGRGQPRTHSSPHVVPAPHTLPSNHQQQQEQQSRLHEQRYQRQQQEMQEAQQRQQQHRPQLSQQPSPMPLLPPVGWVQPQQRQPNPARFSLHQAHLRSPVLRASEAESPLYHFVQSFITPPARLTKANVAKEKWTFKLDAEMIKCIPAPAPTVPGGPDCRTSTTRNKTVRIRCAKWPAAHLPDEHVWAVTDTSWIPYSYFTFNGTSLQQRKKVHHGKDLPMDITGLLKEGENVLEMTVMAHSSDKSFQNYLIAIEVLGIISHNSIRRYCLEKSHVPARQVLADIKRKLAESGEDDDIAVVASNLTVNIFDPFSASKICDIPVRGQACLHNDCFDLDTFLETRQRKGDASVPDHWRCPICNADARPLHLIVDGFLEEVKKVLEAEGRSKTRAIIIHQDGSWKPKPEVRDPNGVSDDPPTPVISRPSIPPLAEIIDLSD